MSITSFYYNKSLRRIVVLFGTLFNGYTIQKTSGAFIKVPLSYSSKNKWYVQIKQNLDKTNLEAIIFPRMGFLLTSIGIDYERKTSSLNYFASKHVDPNQLNKIHVPTPVTLNFSLFIASKTMDEGLQLIEQIIPYFDPTFVVEIDELDSFETPRDIPVTLNSVSFDNDFVGAFDGNDLYTWELQFTVETYLYKNITPSKIIKKVVVYTHIDAADGVEENYKEKYTAEVDPFTAAIDDEWAVLESWGLVDKDEEHSFSFPSSSSSIGGIISPWLNTTDFYKFRFEYQPQSNGLLSEFGNTQISSYEDFYLYELGWLSPNDQDTDHLNLNTSRKSNICLGSDIKYD